MTCPKCHKELRSSDERWYDGTCLEHGRPEPIEGRWYWAMTDEIDRRWEPVPMEWCDGKWWIHGDHYAGIEVIHWLPIPTVQELLLTTKGQI